MIVWLSPATKELAGVKGYRCAILLMHPGCRNGSSGNGVHLSPHIRFKRALPSVNFNERAVPLAVRTVNA
jgi:hypothetical protein